MINVRLLGGLLLMLAAAGQLFAESVEIQVEEGKAYVQESSGMRFPPKVMQFDRTSVVKFDDQGANLGVGYHDRENTLISVYVYPTGTDTLDKHFDRIMHDVVKVTPGAKVTESGKWTLKQGKVSYEGRRGMYSMKRTIQGEERELLSVAYLFQVGKNWVKFRITYPAAGHEQTEARVAEFLPALKLPEPVGK